VEAPRIDSSRWNLIPPACGAATRFEFRVFDPTGYAKTQVVSSDIVRSSAHASLGPGGLPVFSVDFTSEGAKKFHSLTRTLARRGARLHHPQSFALEIGGRVYARPVVDYRAFPDGLDGQSGIQIQGMSPATAQRLARQIRGG